jgi:hypothetical protein
MSVDEFFEMRLNHFFMKVQEHDRVNEEKTKLDCELIRMQTVELININLKPSDKIKARSLWRFPWDEETDFEINLRNMNKTDFENNYKQFLGIS